MTLNLSSYFPRALEKITKNITDFFPSDRFLWASIRKDTYNISRVVVTLATEQRNLEFTVFNIAEHYIPNFTNSFIEDWEQNLGLPDKCLSINYDDSVRRLNIMVKLAYLNLDTAQSYIDLAGLFGTVVIVYPYSTDNPFVWNIEIQDPNVTTTFPFTFNFNFSTTSDLFNLLVCLFTQQKPAHTILNFDANYEYSYSDDNGDIYISDNNEEYTT